jgi:hypothetical protein
VRSVKKRPPRNLSAMTGRGQAPAGGVAAAAQPPHGRVYGLSVLVDYMAMPVMMMMVPVMMAVMDGIGLYDDGLSLGGERQCEAGQEDEKGQYTHVGSPWNSSMEARTISDPAYSRTLITKFRADPGKILTLPEPAAGYCTRAGSEAAAGVGAWTNPTRQREQKQNNRSLCVPQELFLASDFSRGFQIALGPPSPGAARRLTRPRYWASRPKAPSAAAHRPLAAARSKYCRASG